MTKWVVSLCYIKETHLQIYLGAVFRPSTLLFSPIFTSFLLPGLSSNIIPKKQLPLAAALKNVCTWNCLLAAWFRKHEKRISYCCFKQITLAFVFENLIKNQLLSGLCESVILCLQQRGGIIRGWQLELSNGSMGGMRGAAVDESPFCSLLSAELLGCSTDNICCSCSQQNLLKKTTKQPKKTTKKPKTTQTTKTNPPTP